MSTSASKVLLKGQEIVSNREEIITILNQALAGEGLASYLFLYFSKAVSGRGAHEVGEILTSLAVSEQTHVSEIMERIIQLGGEPLRSPSDWEKTTYCKFTPPKINATPREAVEECTRLEREAILFYQDLAHKTQHSDYVTFQLVSRILAEEVADEHKLTNAQ